MPQQLPAGTDDVLSISTGDMPETIRLLIAERKLSGLVGRLHADLASEDQRSAAKSARALRKMGFTD